MRDISPNPSAAFGKSGVRGCQLRMHLACARGETAYKIQLQRKILVRGTIKPVTGNDGDAIDSVHPFERARYGESGHGDRESRSSLPNRSLNVEQPSITRLNRTAERYIGTTECPEGGVIFGANAVIRETRVVPRYRFISKRPSLNH